MSELHVLYRFFDAHGELLYVGRTNNPPQRLNGHKADKDWWRDVSNVAMEHYESFAALEQAERDAIKNENPKYNIVHNKRGSKSRFIRFCGVQIELDADAGIVTFHDVQSTLCGVQGVDITVEPVSAEEGWIASVAVVPQGTMRQWWDELGKRADCHPDKKHHAKGLCMTCYKAELRQKKA